MVSGSTGKELVAIDSISEIDFIGNIVSGFLHGCAGKSVEPYVYSMILVNEILVSSIYPRKVEITLRPQRYWMRSRAVEKESIGTKNAPGEVLAFPM